MNKLFVGCLCLFSSTWVSLPALAGWHGDTQNIMGTVINVTLHHPDDITAEQAITAVMAEMRRIDQQYSPYIPTSELSRVNDLAPKATAAKPMPIILSAMPPTAL